VEETNVEPAGFAIRLGGRLIDYAPTLVAGAFGGVAIAVIAGFIAASTQQSHSAVMDAIGKDSALTYLGGLLATILYHAFGESIGGASLGKRLLGLEVLSEDLRPATFRQGLVRNLGFFVDALFFGLIGYGRMEQSPIKQRYGDQWGKTRVVLRRSLPPELRRPTRIFVFALLGAMALALETITLAHLVSYWLRTL
jgi:uncharacterized RDD family membrane protein YckC